MNQEIPAIHVLIAAAGTGSRFSRNDDDLPKQYQDLAGKPVLLHSIETFQSIDEITSIHCIIHMNHAKWYHDLILTQCDTPHTIGGNERKDSIYNALKNMSNIEDEDIILIHDAARPLVTRDDVITLIDALKTNSAATLATPITGTLRRAENTIAGDIVNRDNLWNLQTPQAFRYKDLLHAHESAGNDQNWTDDTTLASAIGIDVKIVQGSSRNFKITSQSDLNMAKGLLNKQSTDIRTGMGFDVHAFDKTAPGPLRISGIDIDHAYKLKGHSDADVALHAITDAILGAIGAGDIGYHFPPSDNAFKNMDSAVFLQKAVAIARDQNASINNIDLTIICEAPKIGSHADAMKTRIAAIIGIDETRINIKATTTEKLGFTGRGEGIAAQAIATISIKP
ncbi:MAG: 2-C-methyl-D-erythritol 4-phosphate cytidylyltransferase [Bdellovibrionales bacterium]